MHEQRTINREREFRVEKLFYSRTDKRGVIQSGNSVFQDVSGFEWADLIAAPHKLIRHPDMPKGVFWLMWDTVQQGRPIAAYVKNRAKDGSYYWVLANVTPLEDGYLSVRLKPTSDFLGKVQALYAELVEEEQNNGLTPEQSGALLQERICAHGFADYADFGGYAMAKEYLARQAALGQPLDMGLSNLDRASPQIETFRDVSKSIDDALRLIGQIPSNMRIIANRLEPVGGPITAIAINYARMTKELEAAIDTLVSGKESGYELMRRSLGAARYTSACALLQAEIVGALGCEPPEIVDRATETQKLLEVSTSYQDEADMALKSLRDVARTIAGDVQTLKRQVMALSTTRTLCRIENARVKSEDYSLTGVIDSLDAFQSAIDVSISEATGAAARIENLMAQVLRSAAVSAAPAGSPRQERGRPAAAAV